MLTIGLEHFSLFVKRTAVVMAHMAPQQGMNWRDHMGAIICLIGYKVVFINWIRDYIYIYGDNYHYNDVYESKIYFFRQDKTRMPWKT